MIRNDSGRLSMPAQKGPCATSEELEMMTREK